MTRRSISGVARLTRRAALAALLAGLVAADARRFDLVRVAVAGYEDPAVVYRGWRDGACQLPPNEVLPAAPVFNVGDADMRGECPQELLAFTRLHGVYLSMDPPWVGSGGSQVAWVVPPPLTVVHVSIWVVRDDTWTSDLQNQLMDATWYTVFRYLMFRTGIHLKFHVNFTDVGTIRAGFIGQGCQNVRAMQTVFDPLNNPYHSDALNVFVIPNMMSSYDGWVAAGPVGYSCFNFGITNVAYIGYPLNFAITLPHEIGHVLGMQVPDVFPIPVAPAAPTLMVGGFGHTNNWDCKHFTGTKCFPLDDNLMQSAGLTIGSITLGQSYRMNFDARSWLNRPAVAMTRPLVRVCQSDYLWWEPCPTYMMDAP